MEPKKVLVVDDEAHITHVVSLKLTNAGFIVSTAGDGEEALEMALTDPPALVVTDLQMPYMSGLDLCIKLKQHPTTAHIPALMLTARGFALGQADLAKTNIKSVMAKPFSPKDVLAKVREALGMSAEAEGPGSKEAA
jgi:DNA-binding response OmpR family regulator